VANATPGEGAPTGANPQTPGTAMDALLEVRGEVLALKIVRGTWYLDPDPGGGSWTQRLRDPRPAQQAAVTVDLGTSVKVVRDRALELNGAPLDLSQTVLHGVTDDEGRLELKLTGLPGVAIPTDGRFFKVIADGVSRDVTLPEKEGLTLWRALAADPKSRLIQEVPVDGKMLLDLADAALDEATSSADVEDADQALVGFAQLRKVLQPLQPNALPADLIARAGVLQRRLATRVAESQAEAQRLADETPEARSTRLAALRASRFALLGSTLAALKKKHPLPPATCPGGQALLRPFRSDGGWAIGAKECAADAAAALQTYQAGCAQGVPGDCFQLALATEHGVGIKLDIPASRSLYDQACKAGWPAACAREGAAEYACDEGDGEACLTAALGAERTFQLGTAFTRMLGMAEPFQGILDALTGFRAPGIYQLFAFDQQSCIRGDANGCNGLAFMLQNGLGTDNDPVRAAQLYAQACSAGVPQACSRLGTLYGLTGDLAYDAEIQAASCAAGAGCGCTGLAQLYLNGLGVTKDDTRGRDLLQKGCELGDDAACQQRARR
jgi:TPR repeat protein